MTTRMQNLCPPERCAKDLTSVHRRGLRSLAYLLIALLSLNLSVAHADENFAKGNALYDSGKFKEAAAAYESQIAQNHYSGNLFYNLANACQRAGQRGRAILNYRRALALEPNHAEAAANLAFVQGPKSETLPKSAITANALAIALAVFGWLAVFTFALRRKAIATISGVIAIGCTVWLFAFPPASDDHRAVVLEDGAQTFYSPAADATVSGALSAGAEVRVLAVRDQWVYARLLNGERAWLQTGKLEAFIPGPLR